MTLHAAKGLEFPVVYMLAVEQGILPHERSLTKDEDVEEERRLAFVGMTRAKEELYLCHARLREFRGQTLYAVPSMFLDELPAGRRRERSTCRQSTPAAAMPMTWRDAAPARPAGAGTTPAFRWRTRPRHGSDAPRPDRSRAGQGLRRGHAGRARHYGLGRITERQRLRGLRKIKIRFSVGGETDVPRGQGEADGR